MSLFFNVNQLNFFNGTAQEFFSQAAEFLDVFQPLLAGEKVDYAGASGPCDFDDKGDILDCKFRYEQIKGGKFTLLKIA